jgi:hypothetical protein
MNYATLETLSRWDLHVIQEDDDYQLYGCTMCSQWFDDPDIAVAHACNDEAETLRRYRSYREA